MADQVWQIVDPRTPIPALFWSKAGADAFRLALTGYGPVKAATSVARPTGGAYSPGCSHPVSP